MSEKESEVPASVEALDLMRGIAGEAAGKRALIKIARKLPSWSYRHVKAVWYRENRTTISADQMRELRAAALTREENGLTDEILELRNRISRLESALAKALGELSGA